MLEFTSSNPSFRAIMQRLVYQDAVLFLRGDANPITLPSQKVLTKNGFTFETSRSVEEDHSTVDVYSIQI